MKKGKVFVAAFFLLSGFCLSNKVQAQNDLLEALQQERDSLENETVFATFKGSRLINGHTVELRNNKELDFIISHRFGRLNEGVYSLFGLDDASIRLGLDYGLTENFTIGAGRNSFEKVYDGFLKYRFLQQGTGPRSNPVTAVAFAGAAVTTLRSPNDLNFTNRTSYTWQLLLARKFSDRLSLQIMPTLVHHNLVPGGADDNDIYALGTGGRFKLSKRVALNVEYYYQINPSVREPVCNSVSIGFDIETGGHVFQLHLTNARAMQEKSFITRTNGDFFKGDIHFGFNISRVFQF